MNDTILLVVSLVLAILAALGPAVPNDSAATRYWPGLLAASFAFYVATYLF